MATTRPWFSGPPPNNAPQQSSGQVIEPGTDPSGVPPSGTVPESNGDGTATWRTPAAGVSPSGTVTGPDNFGAASTPGTAATYSRGDHDHGLPSLTPVMVSLPAGTPYAMPSTTVVQNVLTSPSLAPGTYICTGAIDVTLNTPANAPSLTAWLAIGTATATISGRWAGNGAITEATSAGANEVKSIPFAAEIVVTVAGTIVLKVQNNNGAAGLFVNSDGNDVSNVTAGAVSALMFTKIA